MNLLEAQNISKHLKGADVLQNINLTLEGGKIYAFQGENGCGKTMLFRVLSGLSAPTEGTVLYNGTDINKKHKNLIKIGIVIENASMFPQFTGYENLAVLAKINGIASKEDMLHALERVGLDPADKRTVRKYSLGMRQRLLIAQAIMEQPDYLFLDEPTNAIDKDGVDLVYRIIREEADHGAAVMMASHIDRDISHLADKRFLMEAGRIVNEV